MLWAKNAGIRNRLHVLTYLDSTGFIHLIALGTYNGGKTKRAVSVRVKPILRPKDCRTFVHIFPDSLVFIVAKICQRAKSQLAIQKQVGPLAFGEVSLEALTHLESLAGALVVR